MYPLLSQRRTLSFLLVSVIVIAALACNAPTGSEPTETPAQSPAPSVEPAASATPVAQATVTAEAPTLAPPPAATVAPTSEFSPPNAPAPNVTYGGISFYRDNSLASEWTVEVTAADVPNNDTPQAWLLPSHYHFVFKGYPLAGTFHDPQIRIFPIHNFENYNSAGLDVIAKLKQFLKDRPANVSGGIPFLPIFNAAQAMRTKIAYLDFQNGSGVRFLTQYDQAPIPINNHEMFYTFQGLTLDGQYYISVIMPISHPSLPADGSEIPGGNPDAFATNFLTYLQGIEQQLNDANGSSFNPSIQILDTLVQSLSIK